MEDIKREKIRKRYNRRYRTIYVKGSSVIEMSYIMPLFLGLFVLIIHAVFYYHDKAVMNGAAGETALLGAQAERGKEEEYDLEAFFRERTEGKLIYMTDTDVSVDKTETEIRVSVSARRSFMKLEIYQKALIIRPERRIRQMRWIM